MTDICIAKHTASHRSKHKATYRIIRLVDWDSPNFKNNILWISKKKRRIDAVSKCKIFVSILFELAVKSSLTQLSSHPLFQYSFNILNLYLWQSSAFSRYLFFDAVFTDSHVISQLQLICLLKHIKWCIVLNMFFVSDILHNLLFSNIHYIYFWISA